MEIKVLTMSEKLWGDLLGLLRISEADFVPTLSSRFEGDDLDWKLTEYMKPKMNCHYVCVYDGDFLCGFTAISLNYIWKDHLETKEIPCTYIELTLIHPEKRSLGIANMIYNYIEEVFVVTYDVTLMLRRTWSTNLKQQHLYSKMGYELLDVIPNHRSNNVDTIIFYKNQK